MNYTDEYWQSADRAADCIPDAGRLFGKTVLITGAGGMICSAVAEELYCLNRFHDAGITVILAGRSEERMRRRFEAVWGPSFRFLQFDANRPELPAELHADFIIHGAGNSNPVLYMTEPAETMLSNLTGTHCLLEFARAKHARLLYISSSEVYGKTGSMLPFTEDLHGDVDFMNVRACYPSAKRAAETLCVAYAHEYGTDVVSVRPGHIYGPGIIKSDERASAQFTRKAYRHETIILKSAGTQVRSYCHTLDCASAILAVLLKGNAGEAYNIANRHSQVSIRQIAEAFAAASGCGIRFDCPTETEKAAANPMNNAQLDPSKLEGLGWHAVFDLPEGVAHTLSHYSED